MPLLSSASAFRCLSVHAHLSPLFDLMLVHAYVSDARCVWRTPGKKKFVVLLSRIAPRPMAWTCYHNYSSYSIAPCQEQCHRMYMHGAALTRAAKLITGSGIYKEA